MKDEDLLASIAKGREERMEARRQRILNPVATQNSASQQQQQLSSSTNGKLGDEKKSVISSKDDVSQTQSSGIDIPPAVEYQRTLEMTNERLQVIYDRASGAVSDKIVNNLSHESQLRVRPLPFPPATSSDLTNQADDDMDVSSLDCYRLEDLLKRKQEAFNSIISSKNEQLKKLREALDDQDIGYADEISRQASEIHDVLAELNKSLLDYRRASRTELERLESAWIRDRNTLIKKSLNDYDDLLKGIRKEHQVYLEGNDQRTDKYLRSFNESHLSEQEEEKRVKAKLEQDLYSLVLKLQEVKATFQLNVEKLEYNYQVLKKREEENAIIVAHQKRKINRLNDMASNLATKIRKQKETAEKELRVLGDDYARIQGNWKDFSKKFERFRKNDARLYQEVSEMFAEDIEHGIRDIVKADKVIWESILGSEWHAPLDWQNIADDPKFFSANMSLSGANNKSVFAREEWNGKYKSNDRHEIQFLKALEEEIGALMFDYPPEEDDIPMRMEKILRALDITSTESYNQLKHSCIVYPQPGDESRPASAIGRVSNVKLLSKILEMNSRGSSTKDLAGSTSVWSATSIVLDNGHVKVWESVYPVIVQYQNLLKNRHDLTSNINEITRENEELRQLIASNQSSKQHEKLKIPPEQTRV